jgi:hypothetical protein
MNPQPSPEQLSLATTRPAPELAVVATDGDDDMSTASLLHHELTAAMCPRPVPPQQGLKQ